jgi:hypothetical protein
LAGSCRFVKLKYFNHTHARYISSYSAFGRNFYFRRITLQKRFKNWTGKSCPLRYQLIINHSIAKLSPELRRKIKLMANNKKALIAAAAILAVGTAGLASITYAQTSGTSTAPFGFGRFFGNNISAATKQKMTDAMDAMKKEMDAKRTAVNAALDNSDYNAWVQAVGTGAPILSKINADNFSKYVQAYNLEKQARQIMADLGINDGKGEGMGMGMGFGGGRGRHGMMNGGQPDDSAPASQNSSTDAAANNVQ